MPIPYSADRSVLAVVDYQNDFCHEDGAITRLGQSTERAREIKEPLVDLIDAARSAGVAVVFVRVAHSPWTDAPAWSDRGAGGAILDVERIPVAQEGSWGAEFYGLSPGEGDLVITKHRYSAFAYTPLHLVLQAKRASTIVIAGVQTNVCVHGTARDAVQEGFLPVVVRDCVASGTENEHETALADIATRMGIVVGLDEIKAAWGSAGAG